MNLKKKYALIGIIIGVILGLIAIKLVEACYVPPTCEQSNTCQVTITPTEVIPSPTEEVTPSPEVTVSPTETPKPTEGPHGEGQQPNNPNDGRSDGNRSSDFDHSQPTVPPCRPGICGYK